MNMAHGIVILGNGLDELAQFYDTFVDLGALDRVERNPLTDGKIRTYRMTPDGFDLVKATVITQGGKCEMPEDYEAPSLIETSDSINLIGDRRGLFLLEERCNLDVEQGKLLDVTKGVYCTTLAGLFRLQGQLIRYRERTQNNYRSM